MHRAHHRWWSPSLHRDMELLEFGHGGARHEAERLGVPFLGEIPLHMSIRTTSDAGTPVVASEPDGPHAAIYRAIGTKVREQLQGAIAAA